MPRNETLYLTLHAQTVDESETEPEISASIIPCFYVFEKAYWWGNKHVICCSLMKKERLIAKTAVSLRSSCLK